MGFVRENLTPIPQNSSEFRQYYSRVQWKLRAANVCGVARNSTCWGAVWQTRKHEMPVTMTNMENI